MADSVTKFSCLACRGEASEEFYRDCEDYYLGKPYRASYDRCRDCGLVQQNPIPKDIDSLYDAYPVHRKKSPLYSLFRRLVMAPCYYDARSLAPGSVVVDYGCGDGWFLEECGKEEGLKRIGFEANPQHAESLQQGLGIPVFADVDTLLRRHEGGVDVVTQHFVLEHVSNLHEVFATVAKLLRPGGTFYFAVPDIDSWESRLFGKKWHNLDAPRHMSFPNAEVARRLAAEHGLRVVREKRLPFPNGIAGSIPVVLTGRFSFPIFLLALPFGLLLSWVLPRAMQGFWLEKGPEGASA